MAVSATQLITRALRLAQIVDAVETVSAEMLANAKELLDDLVDALGAERAMIYTVARNVHPLTSGVSTYTIGTGGTFNKERPLWIDRVSVYADRTASPLSEVPIAPPLTIAEWQAIPQKSTSGSYPTAIFYDYGFTASLGNIQCYPVPDNSNADLILYVPESAAVFADLTTQYTMPRGWYRMFRYNLAVECGTEFGVQVPQRVLETAVESKAVVKRTNWRPQILSLDPMMPGLGRGGRYNINTDGYGGR